MKMLNKKRQVSAVEVTMGEEEPQLLCNNQSHSSHPAPPRYIVAMLKVYCEMRPHGIKIRTIIGVSHASSCRQKEPEVDETNPFKALCMPPLWDKQYVISRISGKYVKSHIKNM